jgi:predicted ATP-dependent Lon-type protease
MVKIYESPDGGKTVYERDTKTGDRICIEKEILPEWHLSELEISEIVDYANEGNRTLQEMLKKLKTIYYLSKEDNEHYPG